MDRLLSVCLLCRRRLSAAPACFIIDGRLPARARVGLIVFVFMCLFWGFRWPVRLGGLNGSLLSVFSLVVYKAHVLATRGWVVVHRAISVGLCVWPGRITCVFLRLVSSSSPIVGFPPVSLVPSRILLHRSVLSPFGVFAWMLLV